MTALLTCCGKKLSVGLVFLLLIAGCGQTALAQQTIFNVPSADVTPKGRLFLQHESQFRTWKPGRFLINTEYAAVGIGHNTEVDLTFFNISSPASQNISMAVGFKSAIPLLDKRFPQEEIKLTVGSALPISLQGNGVGNWTYSHVSLRLPKLRTRLSGGVSYGTKQIFGRQVVSAIAGVEQPLTKRVSLIADWYSGTHDLGLLITGASVALPKDTNLYLGYQIPNTKNSGRQGFVVELSKFLF
jgi:hypothetical protein